VLFELCIFELYKERTETDSRATKLSTRCSIVQKDMFKKYSYLFYSVLNLHDKIKGSFFGRIVGYDRLLEMVVFILASYQFSLT